MQETRLFLFSAATTALLMVTVILAGCRGGGQESGSHGGGHLGTLEGDGSCVICHTGIEVAHPAYDLKCIQCHGGDPTQETKELAHVIARAPVPRDGTVLPENYFDLEFLRFQNPSNLRVVKTTCGQSGQGLGTSCHQDYTEDVLKSLMATNAGEHVGGSYLQGLQADRIAREGIFPIEDLDGDIPTEWGALASMEQVQPEDTSWPEGTVQRHYSDVPRKLCTTCHLWSRGLADRGVAGYEGSYRSEGCAACHFVYADDGLSRSGDSLIDHTEVGHPIVHQITKQIPTQQCAHCHTRGVRIGLSFQGLAQLPPDTPKGGGYVGLTEEPRYGDFLIENAATHPMDIHAERGMHCIDCHVREEIMGDGNLYGHMDQAVQIECTDCHGTVDDYGTGVTERGAVHDNLEWQNGLMLLTGKVNGGIHIVPQVKDIVDPTSVFYNESAAAAMNHDHIKVDGGLECYACHAGWQNNCYGCHFFRDLDETQLDTLAGMETHGLVETGDKYFTDFNNFQMGWNADGKIAPFMASCQVITNVQDATDELIMEQVLPVSGAGLSGLAMNPEQPHTIRPTPRGCVECHRNPAALGLGTENFNLARKYIFVLTSPAGSFSIIDREADFGSGGGGGPKSPGRDSHVVGTIPLPNPKDLAVMTDPIHGVTDWVYVVDGLFGLVVIDCSDPTTPFIQTQIGLSDARDVLQVGTTLYVALGAGGVNLYDITNPGDPQFLSNVATVEARSVTIHGMRLLVADGPGGVAVLDVSDRTAPSLEGQFDLNGVDPTPNDVNHIAMHSIYRAPPEDGIQDFVMLACVADGENGVRLIDFADPTLPLTLGHIPSIDAQSVYPKSHWVFGDTNTPSQEREYLFFADERGGLQLFDITDPSNPVDEGGSLQAVPVYDLAVCNAFEPPHNVLYVYAALGQGGIGIIDYWDIKSPLSRGTIDSKVLRGLQVERVQLDRYVDEDGIRIKDSGHDNTRVFDRAEMERILGVDF